MRLAFNILSTFSLLFSSNSFAQAKTKSGKNIIVKYKQYESFDLGSLEIQGKLVAPGDLSVKERQRKRFGRNLFNRDNFDPEVRKDIRNLR